MHEMKIKINTDQYRVTHIVKAIPTNVYLYAQGVFFIHQENLQKGHMYCQIYHR